MTSDKDEKQATTLDTLREAINDAASKASVVWTTFVTLEVYLAIAFASITQRDLLFGTSGELPLLNVKLPLSGFLVVAPTLFVVFHFYLFLTFRLLVSPITAMNEKLEELPREKREIARQRLDRFFLVQFLAGVDEIRHGFIGFALRIIAWCTTVVAPVVVLLQCQARFLPIHSGYASYLHRTLVIVDLAIIIFFWGDIRRRDTATSAWKQQKAGTALGSLAAVAVIACSALILTYPGESLYGVLPIDTSNSFGGEGSWIPNRIVVFNAANAELNTNDKVQQNRSLAGRDLRYAVIKDLDLQKINLAGANLDNAVLIAVNLKEANFGCPYSDADVEVEAKPERLCASFAHATIERSQLRHAALSGASMPFVTLKDTDLQEATLANADLTGASLRGAKLLGASLMYSRLAGADLTGASLEGALLDRAVLWGADLRDADLRGVSAQFADLQGVKFAYTQLSGATFAHSAAFHAFSSKYMTQDSRSLHLGTIEKETEDSDIDTILDPRNISLLTHRQGLIRDIRLDAAEAASAAWLHQITLSSDPMMMAAKQRLESLNTLPKEAQPWPQENSPGVDQAGLAGFLGALACSAEFAPYVAHGLIANARIAAIAEKERLILIKRLLRDPTANNEALADCPGGRGLEDIDVRKLEKMKETLLANNNQ